MFSDLSNLFFFFLFLVSIIFHRFPIGYDLNWFKTIFIIHVSHLYDESSMLHVYDVAKIYFCWEIYEVTMTLQSTIFLTTNWPLIPNIMWSLQNAFAENMWQIFFTYLYGIEFLGRDVILMYSINIRTIALNFFLVFIATLRH